MGEWIGLGVMGIGILLLNLAAIGVFRLPDAFQRMHASTKAGTFGASLVVVGATLIEGNISLVTAAITIFFLLITIPIAAQLLGRAAYVSGSQLTITGDDPLAGVVERESRPLEERLAEELPQDRDRGKGSPS